MMHPRRARVVAAAASAAVIFFASLAILDIHSPLEALGYFYPSGGEYPRAFIPRVSLPLCPRTTDLHFPVDIGADYSGGVGLQVCSVGFALFGCQCVHAASHRSCSNQSSSSRVVGRGVSI
jgi:hypothetical protein